MEVCSIDSRVSNTRDTSLSDFNIDDVAKAINKTSYIDLMRNIIDTNKNIINMLSADTYNCIIKSKVLEVPTGATDS